MKCNLSWQSEEEGTLHVLGNKTELRCLVYRIGDEEAEISIREMLQEEVGNTKSNQKEVICEVTKCLKEAFRLLWDEGMEEAVLVEKKGSDVEKILGSTGVVQKVYSEYMMRKELLPAEDTTDGENREELSLTEQEDGIVGENRDKTFFCHLQPYQDGYYLFEVEVDKKVRNRGIATRCLSSLFRELAKEKPTVLYLQVGSYNEPAMHLYRKLGFEISEELCYYAPVEE